MCVHSQLEYKVQAEKLCLYTIRIHQILVINPFVKRMTKNSRKEAIVVPPLSPGILSRTPSGCHA